MDALATLSLRHKLIGFGVVIATVALLLAGTAIIGYDQITFRAIKLSNVTAVAEIVGLNAAAALAFDDAAAAGTILNGLRAKPSIAAATLYRRNGEVFATYVRTRRFSTASACTCHVSSSCMANRSASSTSNQTCGSSATASSDL
jgi:hypothetical protein